MKNIALLLALCLTVLAGCGIEWFPETKRLSTTPDPFSFTTRFGVPIQGRVSSSSVVIKGFANSSTASPISISSGSTYSINGSSDTATAGTVKNNDRVKVFQTSAGFPATANVSTLTIGGLPGTFTAVTQTIVTPSFTLTSSQPSTSTELSALISGVDTGGHTITMTGTGTQFAISDFNNAIIVPFTTSTLPVPVLALNNNHILLLIPNQSTGTTTLTIDATNFVISNTTPFSVTSSPK